MDKLGSRDKFAEEFQNALQGSAITPPSSVWHGIDRSLTGEEVVRYRKKVVYYKWAALLAILVAISVSVPSVFIRDSQDSLAIKSSRDSTYPIVPVDIGTLTSQQDPTADQNQNFFESIPERSHLYLATDEGGINQPFIEPLIVDRKNLRIPIVNVVELQVDPYPVYHFEVLSKNGQKRKYWAGLGVGSSSFDPDYQLNTSNVVANALLSSQPNFINAADNGQNLQSASEQFNEGVNYQVGLNLGMRLSDRWTIEGGMQYGETLLSTTTNVVIENRYFTKALSQNSGSNNIQEVKEISKTQEIVEYIEDDVVMNNTFHFASIPIRAGYIILDKKLNLRLNAGLVTNFYLGNTLKDPNNSISNIEMMPGENSPYRTINFSGMAGVTVGYRFLRNVDLLVEPNYSHSLQPLIRSSSNFNSTPSGIGVSAGVRYNFK